MNEIQDQKKYMEAEKKASDSVFAIQKSDMHAKPCPKKKDWFFLFSTVMLCVCLLGVAVSIYFLGKKIRAYMQSDDLYENIRDRFYTDENSEVSPMNRSDEHVYTVDILSAKNGSSDPNSPGLSSGEADQYALLRSKLASLQ
ncbi:MAG TPA: hypothetical protein DER23_07895, partial [Clostridiales bacterium]|nr:hypothetical protein [Clostridiales bacterium]